MRVGSFLSASILCPFVDEQLDGFANSKLQILSYAVGQFVRLLFKSIVEDGVGFAAGAKRIGREKCGEVVEGVLFFAAEGVVEVKAEIAALSKGVAVEEQDLAASEEEDPARGFFVGEDAADTAGPVASTEFVVGLGFELVFGG